MPPIPPPALQGAVGGAGAGGAEGVQHPFSRRRRHGAVEWGIPRFGIMNIPFFGTKHWR
jgi:hypothetical protein